MITKKQVCLELLRLATAITIPNILKARRPVRQWRDIHDEEEWFHTQVT